MNTSVLEMKKDELPDTDLELVAGGSKLGDFFRALIEIFFPPRPEPGGGNI
jgi:hypothetical protein